MHRLLLATAASTVLLAAATAGQAQAQDWTGFYVGGHVGYGFQPEDDGERILFDTDLDGRFGDTVNTTAPANAFSPGFCGGKAQTNAPAGGCSDDDDGLDAGVRVGYDRQVGNWVVGGLAEYSVVDLNDSVSAYSTTPASYTMTRELNSTFALRARVGYAWDRWLPYATAGVVWGDVDNSFATTNGVNTFVGRSDDVNGWQLGGGVETRVVGNVTVGVEYLYTNLDNDSYRVRSQGPAPVNNPFILVNPAGTDFKRSDSEFDFHSLRATVSYRF